MQRNEMKFIRLAYRFVFIILQSKPIFLFIYYLSNKTENNLLTCCKIVK